MDDDTKRGRWPLGLVVETVVSHDGLIRSARVRTGDTTKLRPAYRLVFLEQKSQAIELDVAVRSS